MTPEQRLDRLETIVKLMIKAGLRASAQAREQNEKINILIDAQIRNDAIFVRHDELFAEMAKGSRGYLKLKKRQAGAWIS